MRIAKIALGMTLVTSLPASAQPPNPSQAPHGREVNPNTEPSPLGKLSSHELQVLAHVRHDDEMEVQAGKLAMERGSTPAVRSYGKMLVDDHGSNERQFDALVRKQGQALPAVQPVDAADRADMQLEKATMAKLQGLHGQAFDEEFLRTQVAAHDKTIAKLEKMTATVKTPDLVSMLRSLKPVLEKHLEDARMLLGASVRAPEPAPKS